MFWILLSNLLVFQGIYFAEDSARMLDQWTYNALVLFVVDSGLPIFTLLFGYAAIKLYESVVRKGIKRRWIYIRRAIGLYVLGYVHSFIFDSDILRTYGMMLIYLLLFVRLPARWLTVALLVAYCLNASLFFAEGFFQSIGLNGAFADVLLELLYVFVIVPAPILPMMLLGMLLAKVGVFVDMRRERNWYAAGILLIPLGALLKHFAQFQPLIYLVDNGEVLAFGYVCFGAWLYSFQTLPRLEQTFTAVGRLSLTNYLVQSIVCVIVFVYFGVANKLGAFGGVLFGLALYSLQCVFSVWYIQRFERGPFEYILRAWTNWSWKGKL